MIGYYKMSLIGSSHLSELDGVCQDSSGIKLLSNGWVVAAIADGLGSSKRSDIASDLAVKEILRFVEENLPEVWHEESLISLLRIAFHVALKKIKSVAKQSGNPIKDYDTTLTAIIYNGTNVVYGHVGDGGIITLSRYGDFSVLTIAQKGEEFNTVVPLRAAPDNWIFGESKEAVCSILLLTDGIFDIVCPWLLAKQEQKININYIRPFMDTNILSVKTAADFENVQKEIEEIFSGEQSKHITDDKTIVGIINTEIKPEIKPDDYYKEPDWKLLHEEHRNKLYGKRISEIKEKVLLNNHLDIKFTGSSEDIEKVFGDEDKSGKVRISTVNNKSKMSNSTNSMSKADNRLKNKGFLSGLFQRKKR